MKLEIENWDDRSGNPEPGPTSFGYVYFNDGSRAGYSPGIPDQPPVWEPRTNGGGQFRPITARHTRLATQFLTSKGILEG